MGYGEKQLEELRRAIDCVRCDAVISATPTDLSRIIDCNKPIVRVDYKLEELKRPGRPDLKKILKKFAAAWKQGQGKKGGRTGR
jgi:predicted GTPase